MGTVTAQAGLPTAQGSVVVVKVTWFGIHEAVKIEEEVSTMPDGVATNFAVVKLAASVLEIEQRGPKRWIICVEVCVSHGGNTVPGVGSGRP